jgi:phenylalanyl-tRNA synthetase beta chain
MEQEVAYPTASPFEYRRSATILDKESGEQIGIVGEYKKSVAKGFKLPEYAAGFELDVDALFAAVQKSDKQYQALSRYPSTERDICFQVKNDVTYAEIISSVQASLNDSELQITITPIDIYQPEDGQTKNVTVRIRLTPTGHTLNADEINTVIKTVIDHVITTVHATVI